MVRSRFLFLPVLGLCGAILACGGGGATELPPLPAVSTRRPTEPPPTSAPKVIPPTLTFSPVPPTLTFTPIPPTATSAPLGVPTGLSVALAAPAGGEAQFGSQFALTLDANGDPIIAYLNGATNVADTTLNVVRWERAQSRWSATTTVAKVGDPLKVGAGSLALAFDTSTNRIGLLYGVADQGMWLAYSTDGATWQSEKLPSDTGTLEYPQLAMANNQTYIAFSDAGAGVDFFSRLGTTGAFKIEQPALVEGAAGWQYAPPGLAVDSTGQPMMAYWLLPPAEASPTGKRHYLAVWRPGDIEGTPVTFSENPEGQNARLAFGGRNTPGGEQPIIVFSAERNNSTNWVWATHSTDGGKTWVEPVNVPQDGGQIPYFPFYLGANAQGQAALTYQLGGGYFNDSVCGWPKLVRSSDLKQWTVCSPNVDPTSVAETAIDAATLAIGPDGKISMLFRNSAASPKMGAGLWLWREP